MVVAFERELAGLPAVCMQHEIDHLDGKLFIDRLWLVQKLLVRRSLAALTRKDRTARHPPAVAHQLQQRPVRIAEIDAASRPAGTVARDRPELDNDATTRQMRRGLIGRPGPDEAQIAAARCHRQPCHR